MSRFKIDVPHVTFYRNTVTFNRDIHGTHPQYEILGVSRLSRCHGISVRLRVLCCVKQKICETKFDVKVKEFALHAGKWIVWSKTEWSDSGWIHLVATPIFKAGETGRFYLSWNGDRFADSTEMKRAMKRFPLEVEGLQVTLRRMLPRRSEAA